MDWPETFLQAAWWPSWLIVAAVIFLQYGYWQFARSSQQPPSAADQVKNPPLTKVGAALAERLPEIVFFRQHATFNESLNSYWSKQNRDITPECIIKPGKDEEVSIALTILKNEFDSCIQQGSAPPTFAVRSGGHSTLPGASNTSGGIVIDLSNFNQVTLANDRASVLVGSGARWGHVSRTLDPFGVAVVGGRNSDVGVGGLALGGGYSYFSPQYGFACDNVLEYTIVLSSGTIEVVSEHKNYKLWRALKGGANNFGIVTLFRLRSVPCTNVWSGFLYMFSWKAPEVLRAFHEFGGRSFNESAGGPLTCISYVQSIGMMIISTHLMYTKPTPWPACWENFNKISRIWSSTKTRTVTSTGDELDSISPAGFRQLHISTTIQNDLTTLEFVHTIFKKKTKLLRKVKGMCFTLVLQPLHVSTMRHGEHNIFGLRNRSKNLIVVLFTAVWERVSDDDLVLGTGRQAIDEINEYAEEKGTADQFRYLNWCDGTQRPFYSYGKESLRELRATCKRVDPDGFFQKACLGGHKIMED